MHTSNRQEVEDSISVKDGKERTVEVSMFCEHEIDHHSHYNLEVGGGVG